MKKITSVGLLCVSLLLTHIMSVPVGTLARSYEMSDRINSVEISVADEKPIVNTPPDACVSYEVVTEDIAFETIYVSDPTLVYNTQKVVTEGVVGQRSYTYEILESGDNVISRTLVKQEVVREAQNKIIHVGDDPTTPYGEMIVPTQGKLTSCYGYRPGVGASNYHYGIDIAWREGTPVWAADGGVVTKVKTISSFGLYIVIDHGDEVQTLYAHLDYTVVKVGDKVARGQLVGYMGESGNATAPCLHFEVIVNGDRIDPLNGYITKGDIVAPND